MAVQPREPPISLISKGKFRFSVSVGYWTVYKNLDIHPSPRRGRDSHPHE
jgi:hypothetical protein